MAALAKEHDIHAPFLRTIRWQDEEGERSTLVEVDAAQLSGHAHWLALDEVDPTAIAPVFPDGVTEWLAEQQGVIPAERAPWARPGWLADATRWVASVAPGAREPRLVRQWPLSAMYAFDSALGLLYFKACFVLWPQEPAATALLAREHPQRIPEIVAINDEHSWLLMTELEGVDVADAGAECFAEELRVMASLQRDWAGKTAELASARIPYRPLEQLGREAPDLGHLCAQLEAFGIPETLTQGDLHQWNAKVVADRVVILDWSDAAIAHPFLDLGAMLFYCGESLQPREALIDAYIDCWRDFGPDAQLREAAAIAEALGCVYQAISFRAINTAFEPADRWLFAGEVDRWMNRARDLAASL